MRLVLGSFAATLLFFFVLQGRPPSLPGPMGGGQQAGETQQFNYLPQGAAETMAETIAENDGGLSVETVRSWCSGKQCDADRFEQTPESNGVVNPNSVHFKSGLPVSFRLPGGVYLQNWDCFEYTVIDGPVADTTTCEGTFRLS